MKRRAAAHLARLGMLASAALVLAVLENLVPRPLPWMKLGLGNLAVLLALLLYGGRAALAVSLVKLLVGSLITGSLAGPAFTIAGGAGLASLGSMCLVWRAAPRLFSPVGLSILGAVVHQLAQLLLAFLYIRQAGLWGFLPLALATGLISGALIGLMAHWTRRQLRAGGWPEAQDRAAGRARPRPRSRVARTGSSG